MLTPLKAQRRGYLLKLEYDSLDQDDACPTFELRVVSKPQKDVINEDVSCMGYSLPPSHIPIDKSDFSHSAMYSMNSNFLEKVGKRKSGSIQYDVVLDFVGADPDAEFYLDIETKTDFIATSLSYQLMYEDKDKTLRPLGKSIILDSGNDGRS
jgi:hypothetical protein